jgi:hypothetical protein
MNRIEGLRKLPILIIGEENENGRIYTQEAVDTIVKLFNMVRNKLKNPVLGELGHPDSVVVSAANVSHEVVELIQEGNILYGMVQLFGSSNGLKSAEIIDDLRLGARLMGTVNEDKTVNIDDLIAFDLIDKQL